MYNVIWLYTIGRSRSSVSHQLAYVGEKVKDLHLINNLSSTKGEHTKTVGFNSGKKTNQHADLMPFFRLSRTALQPPAAGA